MSWRHYYRDNDGTITEITDQIDRALSFSDRGGLTTNAEQGTVGSSEQTVDDPDGDVEMRGHRVYWVEETECAGDAYDGRIWQGYTRDRTYSRERDFQGPLGRTIRLSLDDLNTVLDRRIQNGSENNRPAETDVERIAWLLTTNEASLIDDDLYFSTDDPVDMDACDYRGQSFRQILDDCSQQAQKNYFLWLNDNEYSLWYAPRQTTEFQSAIRISNDPAEIDVDATGAGTVFPPSADHTLKTDPSRVYSGGYGNFARGHVYVQRESIAEDFARRDSVVPMPNVKTAKKAKARINAYLTSNRTEDDVISVAIKVLRSQSNDVVAGQRIQVLFTHLTNYRDWRWMRVLNRTIRELDPAFVELALELTPDEDGPDEDASGGGTVYGTLQRCIAYDVLPYCYFARPGDNPQAGDPPKPTVGLITPIQDLDNPYAPTWTYTGWLIGGDGTIDATFYTSTIGITPTSVTFAITLNDVPVASVTQYNADTGNGNDATVTVTGLTVANGDILRATCVADPQGVPFFRAPRGTGDAAEALTITGGTLV